MPAIYKKGLQHKLTRVFLLQALLISVAVVLGIFVSAKIFENVLVKEALEGEAAHYWARYEEDNAAAVPDTLNLLGYTAVGGDMTGIPGELRSLRPGYHRMQLSGGTEPLVYVEDRADVRLFLVFDEEQVASLAFYFGIVPLSLALIVIYLLSWFSYRQSRRAVSPIIRLAQKVEAFDFSNQKLGEMDLTEFRASPDTEVFKLVDALDQFTDRVEQFIEREKNFTRDASHEIRTPLAVIKSSVALLNKRDDFEGNEKRALVLVNQTISDMESLIETLLLLAREEFSALPVEQIVVNDLLSSVAYQVEKALSNDSVSMTLEEKCLLQVKAPEKVLTILFSNLLRNAFSYTHKGEVVVTVDEGAVTIKDNGTGMSEHILENIYKPFFRGQSESPGHGLGLSIVKRLCGHFGWTLKIISKPGRGTEVSVLFPESRQSGRTKSGG